MFLKKKKYNKFNNIKYIKSKNNLIVLGNGPSLTKDIDKIKLNLNSFDFYAVNKFCKSDIYEYIKPCGYFFLDPIFFSENQEIKELLNIINSNTSWKMQVFIPEQLYHTHMKKILTNENIEVIPMSFKDSRIFLDTSPIKTLILKTGFFMFPAINVLIFSIFTGIWAKYDAIYIYGADASFHLDTTVDQKTNELIVLNRHFNETDQHTKCAKDIGEYELCSMSEFLEMNYIHFRSHEKLYGFAKNNKVDIINKSSFSLIDAYPRSEA